MDCAWWEVISKVRKQPPNERCSSSKSTELGNTSYAHFFLQSESLHSFSPQKGIYILHSPFLGKSSADHCTIKFSTIKAALITNSLQSCAQILSSCCSCTSKGGEKRVRRRKEKHAILGIAGFYSLVVLLKAVLENSNGNLLGQH